MQAIDDASETLNALRSTIESTAKSSVAANDESGRAAAGAARSHTLLFAAIDGVSKVAKGLAGIFEKVAETSAFVGAGLDDMYVKALNSAVAYAEQTERVAFVTGLSTEKADALISAFRAQGLSTEEAAGVLQRLEMRLGAFGVQAGRTAAEASKLEAEIKRGGKAGTEAKQKLTELDDQTGGMVTNLRQLGLSYEDVTGHGRSMDTLLPSIIDHLKAMIDPMERARLASQLFGRNYGDIAPLLTAGGAAFLKAEGDAKRFGNSLSKEQVEALHSFKAAQEQAKEAIEGFTGDMALVALPVLKAMQETIRDIAGAYDRLPAATRNTIQSTLALVAIFGPLLGGMAALKSVLGTVSSMFRLLGLETLATSFGMVAGGIEAIIFPIGLLLAAVIALKLAYDHIPAVHKAIDDTLKSVMNTFNLAIGIFKATGSPLTALEVVLIKLGVPFQTVNQWATYLRQAFDFIVASLQPLMGVLRTALIPAFVQLKPVMAELQQAFVQLRPVMDVIGPIFALMAAAALILLGGAFKAFVGFLITAIPAAIQIAVDVIRLLVDTFRFLSNIVKNVAAIIMDIVHGDFNQAFLDIRKLFFQMGEDIMFIVGDLVKGIVDLVIGLVSVVIGTVTGFVMGIVQTFKWLWDQLVGHSIVPDMINAIIKWFESLPDRILGIIANLATRMLTAAAQIGISVVTGIVNGLYSLDSAMSHAIGRAINNVPGIGGSVDDALGLPHYAMGGWVNAPLGQSQLAVVHGGEFIQSRAMVAAGVSAGGRATSVTRGGGDLIVQVILDGKVIQRQVMKGGANDFRLRGGLQGSNA
jgi:TP901 family phage tail tape measure protein